MKLSQKEKREKKINQKKGINMDNYTKFVLTIIALCLVGINVQLFKDDVVSKAYAHDSLFHDHNVSDIINIEDHDHGFTPHPHDSRQISVYFENSGERKPLNEVIAILMKSTHNHFWN